MLIVKFWDDLLNDAEIIHNENLRFESVFDYAKWENSEKGTSEVGKTVEFSVTTNPNCVEIAKVVFVHSMKWDKTQEALGGHSMKKEKTVCYMALRVLN